MEFKEGAVLAGKYRIERVLGQGGMGVVVAALHLQLGERVALKFLLPEALNHPEAVGRFAREARAAVRIKSEHVARVSDVGVLDTGAPYMVMEYLDGIDLSAWVTQRGPMPVEQAAEFLLQACEAIAEAHALGIVHRDLKPANLFIVQRADGSLAVKVLDFGISKTDALGPAGSLTKTSAAMGSPLYMSPEQLQSARDVDARGDIWSLGVVLYELVSGQPPFGGETLAELVLKIVSAAPLPLGNVRLGVPPGFEALIAKCLAKDRNQRFRTVGELAVALFPFAPRHSRASVDRISGIMQRAGMSSSALEVSPPPAGAAESGARGAAGGTNASWGQTAPSAGQRGRALLAVGALVFVPVLAAALYLGLRKPAAPAASAEAGPQTPVHVAPPAALVAPPDHQAAPDPPPAVDSAASSAPAKPINHDLKAPASPASKVVAHAPHPSASKRAGGASPPSNSSPASDKNPLKMTIQ